MAFISMSKPYQWKPRVYHLSLPRSSDPTALSLSRLFSSTEEIINGGATPESQTADAKPETENPSSTQPQRERFRRGKRQNHEKLEDTICRMMENRAWTTRLQNSIRDLVPEWDNSLAYNVLHGARKVEHALQFFRWSERSGLIRHDRDTHMKMIEMLGRVQKLNHARCILLEMPEKGVEWDEDMFVVLIDSYGKAGIIQESVKIFQKMKELGVNRTIKSYDALFKVILRRGRYMMAKRYFNAMLSSGIEPTRHTYNIMLWGFFLSLRLETATRFYEDMNNRGILPDVVTYNTMINGFYRFKKMGEAEKLFVEMKGKNIEPSVVSYTTMIKGYVAVERVDDGLRMLEEMKSFGIEPNATTYSTLLPGLCAAGKMTEAKNILKEMMARHIAPNDNSIFLDLLVSQCKAGDLVAASDVLKAMATLNVPAEAGHYGVLIENFCKANAYNRAVKLLDKLVEKEIVLRHQSSLEMEASAYNPIIEYLCNNGQTSKAEVFFRQLMKKGVQDQEAFNSLLRGHAKEGNPDSSYEILKIMSRRGVPREANAYEMLIESYMSKGEPADAKTAMDSMIEDGHIPDASLFRSVMDSLFEDGRVQTASRVMTVMIEKNVGVKENMELVAKILEALLMRGHVEEALGRIDLLTQNGHSLDLDGLLSVLSEKGKTIPALKLLDFGLERDYNIEFSSYDKVLDSLLASGKTLNAYSALCKIMEKGGITDWKSCDELIKSLNQEGNTKQADVLSRMIKNKKGQGSKKHNSMTL
ncbi:PREDICTED: pentatricopeptide repeat-containing protein At2g37230 [Tarenaya hassleriana]|uniref:pentatricopeptide repeat-containing protein At2g37230 n=1 Tax=Tarenaya hassleriana TaxID=28532 RepID=UPI00053C12BD|nr:PREDICTED: pentatricopeptide repeat-containing protein At2g37230 [Tarenaya hassleriana]